MLTKKTLDRAQLLGTISALAAVLGAAPASAQQQNAAAQPQATAPLEEVIVTAERREQNLQDLPLSATVLNADKLADYSVNNVNDVQFVAPSVAINTYNRSTFINIRGVGIAQSAPTSNPGVAYYIDGVYIPHEQFIGQSFYDLAAIEVLRGPQGTLTGQNSTGGAVYTRTPAPQLGEWSGVLDQTIGDYSWQRTVGAVNIPLGDIMALRVSGVRDRRDSFTKNIGPTTAEPGNINLDSYRAALLIDPAGPLNVVLRYEHFNLDTFHNAIKNRLDAVTKDPFTIEEDAPSQFMQTGFRASIEARYDLGDSVQLRYLMSHQDGMTYDVSDGDRTATALPRPPASNVGRVSAARTNFLTNVHEFNILSTGDHQLDWVVGLFYLNEEVPVTLQRDNNHTNAFVTITSDIRTVAENTSKSVFGQVSYQFAPEWEVIAGARYSEDEQTYNRYVAPPTALGVSSTSSDQTTGRVALNWTPHENLLVYGSVSRGYKAGGVNLNLADGAFAPEINTVEEFGVKTTIMDGHLRLNGDVFMSQYDQIQLASLRGAPPLPLTQNAAGGLSKGVELEAEGLFGNLGFNFGVAYLNAEFDGDSTLQDAITNTNGLVHDGDPLPFAPDWTANGGVQYDIEFGNGLTVTPRIQFSHLGEQLATPFRHTETVVPEHTIWDAKLIFTPNNVFRVEAFVTNISDEVYIASQVQNSSSADGGIIYGAPRQVGVRLTANFH